MATPVWAAPYQAPVLVGLAQSLAAAWAKPTPLGLAQPTLWPSQRQTPAAKRGYFFGDDLPPLLSGLDLLSVFDLLSLLGLFDSDSFLAPAL